MRTYVNGKAFHGELVITCSEPRYDLNVDVLFIHIVKVPVRFSTVTVQHTRTIPC